MLAAERQSFDIPAESADLAVRKYVEQADLSVLYESGRLTPYRTHELKGEFEPLDALRILLEGSGLTFSMINSHVISVDPVSKEKPPVLSDGSTSAEVPTVVILASAHRQRESEHEYIGRLISVSDLDLATGGYATISDWVRALPQNQGSGPTEDTYKFGREAPTNTAIGSGINLYGIGQRATLVLVNGRRLAPSGSAGSFTDVSNIPISAVARIDIMPDGASTLYGSDSMGGIVNIVLHDPSSRPMTTVAMGHGTSGSLGEKLFSQSWTHQGDRLGGIVSFEYYSRAELPASSRTQGTSNLTPFGGDNFNSPYSNPATIIDNTGKAWGVPSNQDGTSRDPSKLLPYANSSDTVAGTWLLPHQQRMSFLANATYELADHWRVFFESLGNRRSVENQQAPFASVISVPNSNPFYMNPVARDQSPLTVLYNFGKDLGDVTEQGTVYSGQFALGLDGALSETWGLSGYVGYTVEDQHIVDRNLVNFTQLNHYLATDNAATAFNPFGDGRHTPISTLDAIRAQASSKYDSAFTYADLSVSGSLPLSSAGPMSIAAGYDYRVQTFESTVNSPLSSATGVAALPLNRDRTVSAVFVQTTAPIIKSDSGDKWPVSLDVTGGLRYEHVSDSDAAVTPSVGLQFQPHPSVWLRGTWARLARPPNLPDLNDASNVSGVLLLADPKAGAGYERTLVWQGNNSGLHAETAHSWTFGVAYSPVSIPEFSMEATYFNIVEANRIAPQQQLSLAILSDPQSAYLITRNVTPALQADVCSHSQFLGSAEQCLASQVDALVDLRLRNSETLLSDGLDFNSRYSTVMPAGALAADLSGTYILHYKLREAPDLPLISFRNTPHNPVALRLRGSLSWSHRGFSISPSVSFQSSYTDTDSNSDRPIGSWLTCDLVLGYEPAGLNRLWPGQSTVSLRGTNIFNKQPPFLNNSVSTVGYDPENGDLFGRRISIAFAHRW